MKQQPGKDMVIFGSGSIVSTFMQLGLIDEYRIIVNPVVLGNGKSLFKGINDKHHLKLLKTKVLGSGVVILYYQPGRKTKNDMRKVSLLLSNQKVIAEVSLTNSVS